MLYFILLVFSFLCPVYGYEILHQEGDLEIGIPYFQLGKGSLYVSLIDPSQTFAEWTEETDRKMFRTLCRVADRFAESGIHNYLVIGQQTENNIFHWEIVPYDHNKSAGWQQFLVSWRLFVGGLSPTKESLKKTRTLFGPEFWESAKTNTCKSLPVQGSDPFCDPQVIEKQIVYEREEAHILYDYNPLLYHHLLVLPKAHKEKMTDLSEEEFAKICLLARLTLNVYRKDEIRNVYLHFKTGEHAGQTVPHFHCHVIGTTSKFSEIWGKYKLIVRLLLPKWPLSKDKLQERVYTFREKFFQATSTSVGT